MPFTDQEARRAYQRELMRKRRAEERGTNKQGLTESGANIKGSNAVSPKNNRATRCPNNCGYKTRDHEKLQRHLEKYCPLRKVTQGTNNEDMVHKSVVRPSTLQGNLIKVKSKLVNGELRGKCPVCGDINVMDPARSFRPLSSTSKCEHFQQLEVPGKWSDFLFNNASVEKPEGLTRTNRTNAGTNTLPTGPDIRPQEYPRIWLQLDHSVDKYQIILKESLDGISWRTVTILKKGQAFERNGLIISGTWHKGSEKEADI